MPLTLPAVFTIDYDAAHRLLVCRWLHDTPDRELQPSPELLLKHALTHDECRYWLFDMRQQQHFTPTVLAWFGDLLSGAVVEILGSPVFIGCVAAEQHRPDIESIATETMLREKARDEFYPCFFDSEQAAIDWLVYSQVHPHRPPSF